MSDVVIRVENLSKKYTIRHQADGKGSSSGDGLRHALQDAISAPWRMLKSRKQKAESSISAFNCPHNTTDFSPGLESQLSTFPPLPSPSASSPDPSTLDVRPSTSEDFWALKDVSFEVRRGEVLGIIGRNGAGKSTLLKILSRITEPTSGRIGIKGRVASLLEVGTGFHQELSGRENIFLNGAILGMSRGEVKRKFDEIIAFAEVEKFLDTPVKRYSSGMYVRLAFAVAAHLDPEVLIVDEVLAVGDEEFQRKCMGKMRDMSHDSSRTVLFVSHNMAAIQSLCRTAISLREGKLEQQGSSTSVVGSYLTQRGAATSPVGRLTKSCELVSIRFSREFCASLEPITISFRFRILEPQSVQSIIPLIYSDLGQRIGVLDFAEKGFCNRRLQAGEFEFCANLDSLSLSEGLYHIGIYICADSGAGDFLNLQQLRVHPSKSGSSTIRVPMAHRGIVEFQFTLTVNQQEF